MVGNRVFNKIGLIDLISPIVREKCGSILLTLVSFIRTFIYSLIKDLLDK